MSIFADSQSSNNIIITQSWGNPEFEEQYLSTREVFEKNLEQRIGIQYVVVHDPMATQTYVDGQPNPLWIIRKQNRLETGPHGKIEILDYFYIAKDVVFQAPRLDSILSYRLVNASRAIDGLVNMLPSLLNFSASNGYSYTEPKQQSKKTTTGIDSLQSKIASPAPDITEHSQLTKETQSLNVQSDLEQSDERTMREALQLTLRYGKQYADDAPLIGEPGNFRYSTSKDTTQGLRPKDTPAKSAMIAKAGTPAPTQNVLANLSSAPQTPRPNTAADLPKPKRKKSRAANDSV